MNIKSEIVKRITEYIRALIISVGNIHSQGVIAGKTSIGLTLLTASPHIEPDVRRVAESVGVSLLEEAFHIQTEDVSFRTGLSGIDYAVLLQVGKTFHNARSKESLELHHTKIVSGIMNHVFDIDMLHYLCKYSVERDWRLINMMIINHSKHLTELMTVYMGQNNRLSRFDIIILLRHFFYVLSEVQLRLIPDELKEFIIEYNINVKKGLLPEDLIIILCIDKITSTSGCFLQPFSNCNSATSFWTLPIDSQIALMHLLPKNQQMKKIFYSLYVKRPLEGVEQTLKRTCITQEEFIGREKGIGAIVEALTDMLK